MRLFLTTFDELDIFPSVLMGLGFESNKRHPFVIVINKGIFLSFTHISLQS